jgi:hypothetical protein
LHFQTFKLLKRMKHPETKFLAIFLISLLLLITSCKHIKRVPYANVPDLKIQRFEDDLFSISIYHLNDSITFLQSKYPKFFPLFTNKIIEIGDASQSGFKEHLTAFVTDFTIYNVHKKVEQVFSDFTPFQHKISMAFHNFATLFPDRNIPEIITCISGFNQSIVVADSLLSISLDKYLGSHDEFYKFLYPPVPEYEKYVMHPAKIPSDVVIAFTTTEFPYNDSKDNLLSKMIFEGRTMYFTKSIMEDIQDSLLWGFTPGQLNFCRKNEKHMWTFLIEQKYLFNSDKLLIVKYIDPAPFTKDFSKESPGRAAVWLGYRIVESFMKHNNDIDIQHLMLENDYLKILNLSKYNP